MMSNKEGDPVLITMKDHTWARGVRGAMQMRVVTMGITKGDRPGEEMDLGRLGMEKDHPVVAVAVGVGSGLDRLFWGQGGEGRGC